MEMNRTALCTRICDWSYARDAVAENAIKALDDTAHHVGLGVWFVDAAMVPLMVLAGARLEV